MEVIKLQNVTFTKIEKDPIPFLGIDSKHCENSENWEEVAQDSMNEAAEKERNFAIADGRISKTGVPIIDVVADGCIPRDHIKKTILLYQEQQLSLEKEQCLRGIRESASDVHASTGLSPHSAPASPLPPRGVRPYLSRRVL
ncbi:unnamed protein product [Diatraea saccharalis]|uniref:Uncharacterized protein n=1 Tax=Diatraea saccharalis TaxID=40085 RepID=A0A9N9N440_9NEOP|nr:unnamed protein product [Diatraea saccharalis]